MAKIVVLGAGTGGTGDSNGSKAVWDIMKEQEYGRIVIQYSRQLFSTNSQYSHD